MLGVVAIIGKSGVGKSTISNHVSRGVVLGGVAMHAIRQDDNGKD